MKQGGGRPWVAGMRRLVAMAWLLLSCSLPAVAQADSLTTVREDRLPAVPGGEAFEHHRGGGVSVAWRLARRRNRRSAVAIMKRLVRTARKCRSVLRVLLLKSTRGI